MNSNFDKTDSVAEVDKALLAQLRAWAIDPRAVQLARSDIALRVNLLFVNHEALRKACERVINPDAGAKSQQEAIHDLEAFLRG